MKALRDFIGIYRADAPDSPVTWYYGQAWSLGLIQAARMAGRERPVLHILRNREILDELYRSGFDLVRNNATKAIVERILPELDAQVLTGTNPRHVGARLKRLFGAKNSDWERLARTELSMAAERAKLDEWRAEGVEMIEFVPAPDACPICEALAGEYPVAVAPVPGRDTHPRCRCATTVAESEVPGEPGPKPQQPE